MKSVTDNRSKRKMSGSGLATIVAVAGGLVLLLAANAHLLYVALQSQPDCVPHSTSSGAHVPGIAYGAAKSAC